MLDDEEIALSLIRYPLRLTGWFTPEGKLLYTEGRYEHFALLSDSDRYSNLISAHRMAEEKEQEHSREFAEDSRRYNDGHCPWHAYDASDWDKFDGAMRLFVLSVAYTDGFIRFYIDKQRKKLNVETTEKTFEKNRSALQRIVRKYNRKYELEFNPVQLEKDLLEEFSVEVSTLGDDIEGLYEEVSQAIDRMNSK